MKYKPLTRWEDHDSPIRAGSERGDHSKCATCKIHEIIENAIDTFSKVHFYTHECILAFCMLVSFIILLHTSSFRSQFVSDSYLWQLWAISLQVN